MKKTVLSASIPCSKCKVCIMKAVTKLQGVDEISVDAEKGKVTVIGTADPVLIVAAVKKATKVVRIDNIGDHPPPPEPAKSKPAEPDDENKPIKEPAEPCNNYYSCPPAVVVGVMSYDEPTTGTCIIV